MRKAVDISGQRFGKLIAISRYQIGKQSWWTCRCDCGRTLDIRLRPLRNGQLSCGCRAFTAGGMSATPTYDSWYSMIQRCTNPKTKGYERYGGSGITVCESWRDILNFIKDVGERPSLLHTIERIDNTGNYEPGNVKWATMHEQSRNKSINKFVFLDGKEMCLADAAKATGNYSTSLKRWLIQYVGKTDYRGVDVRAALVNEFRKAERDGR